jgi:hypothetical protein
MGLKMRSHRLPLPKTGKPKNKIEKVGVFSTPKNRHTKHHDNHAFHHKFTTQLPPQNTRNSAKPPAKSHLHHTGNFSSNKKKTHLTLSAI